MAKKTNKYPRIIVDLEKIKHNALVLLNLTKKFNINICAVTKSVSADVKIAKALKQAKIDLLADSRIDNIKKLKKNKIKKPFMLLRSPMLSKINEVIEYVDISLNTEIKIIKALSKQAIKRHKTHKIVLMIEMGDLREGILKKNIFNFIDKIKNLKGIEIYGIGMNLTCFGAVIPTMKKVKEFDDLVEAIQNKKNIKFKMVSAGNSSFLYLLKKGFKTKYINHLRLGEAIMLGKETAYGKKIKNLYDDAFVIEAEIIELKIKDSIPTGLIGKDAFGNKPKFENEGKIKRSLLAIGKEDIVESGLELINKDAKILGSSSDHLIVHLKSKKYKVGDILRFKVNYGSLLQAFISQYVQKVYKH
jgi:predicted amino acid racemase